MNLALAALLLAFTAQDPKFSGPQKGGKTPGFQVFDVGSRQEADYVTDGKGGPPLIVFIHDGKVRFFAPDDVTIELELEGPGDWVNALCSAGERLYSGDAAGRLRELR
jgi:hypothetical protein